MKTPTRRTVLAAASRLTDRDRDVLSLLARHQVLTTHHIARAFFDNPRVARRRIQALCELGLIDCFRPPLMVGTSPKHCVVTSLGILAVDADSEASQSTHIRAVSIERIALRPDLKHLVGVNDVFCSLLEAARHAEDSALELWWPERACTKTWGAYVRPDGFGRWREGSRSIDFFLEFDRGTEHSPQILAKLPGYAAIAQSTGIVTPVLFWLHSARREAALRQRLARTACEFPIATASGDAKELCAAGPMWQMVGVEDGSRRSLAQLAEPERHRYEARR